MRSPIFCPQCATRYSSAHEITDEFHCANPICRHIVYVNAAGVGNLIIPHDGGIFIQKRGIDPGFGLWSLPGGHIMRESWRAACARESVEEINVDILAPHKSISPFWFESTPDGAQIILFGVVRDTTNVLVGRFKPNRESTERKVLRRKDWPHFERNIAFDLHKAAISRYFA